ncbi:Frizzled domain [Trinorchestia longiramus]|nr:Frizzled domain [Trinorchestia longiramus]
MIWTLILLLWAAQNKASAFTTLQKNPLSNQCLPLRVPSCQNLGYNETSFPNFLGTRSHIEAEESMASYNPWLQYGCSSELRLFLCGFYAPMCSPAGLVVPCQSFCKFVRAQCSPILRAFGYSWPADLECSRLPASNTPGNLCMESPVHRQESQTEFPLSKNRGSCTGVADCACSNNAFRVASFSPQDKEFASVWMAIWSVVCFGVTVFTLVSFILSRTRYGFLESVAFRYPDRCCLHMVVCYCMVSAGYLMRLGLGPSFTTCVSGDEESGSSPTKYENREMAVLDTSCVLVFLLLYYFTNAAAMWFSVLCCCWLGGVWRNWGHAVLLRGAVYMHLVAWGIPAMLSILVLNRRVLMPDQLTGEFFA